MAAIAATVALAVGIYALNSSDTVLRTQLGERREMALADGSEVALAPNTQLRVNFTSRGRSITLDYGEAFFHVSKDPNRPFIVSSAHARAQALGTSFSVEDRGDTAVVTVIEGRVAVKGPEPGTADVALGANQRITVSHRGTAPVRQVDGRVELAWSQGQLVFDNETVATIVSRFNDYNKLKIRVTDPNLAAQRISGVFRATDPESFVAFLESVDGLTARRDGATELVIESSRVAQPAVLPR
jgi:transmembrane sensor